MLCTATGLTHGPVAFKRKEMTYIGTRTYPYGRMIMSHMAADTLEELHTSAALVGIDRRHFQDKPGKPHYDICQKNKARLLKLGATEVNDRELIRLYRAKYIEQ